MQDLPPQSDKDMLQEPGNGFPGMGMPVWIQVANGLFLTILLAASSVFVWVMGSLPRIDGQIPVRGLELPAQISRDRVGIPKVTARSSHDAFFTIGWIHAQDRLWQMEWQRRIGAGRLAELVGPSAVASDRFMRTLGLYRLAAADVDRLDQPTHEALTAYAEGVNSWLDANRYRLPPEFILLNAVPEPWTPADSLVWGRMMALQLAGDWRDDLLRAKLSGRLGPRRLNELWPSTAGAPVAISPGEAQSLLSSLPEVLLPRQASNAWAVSGALTASGKPLLANDPHLPFQSPSLWYLLAVEAPGIQLSGATIPGNPFHLVAHNGRIAWGLTASQADTVDLVAERLSADGGYQHGRTTRPFSHRMETIRVKGGADIVLAVRETMRGPVMSDLIGDRDPTSAERVLVLRAVALEPDDLTAQAFLKIGRAVDWRGFSAALKDFHSPALNLIYADTEGGIGFMSAGRVPRRKGGDGTLPAEGWSGRGEWQGWVPFDRLPQDFNPKSQKIVNANTRMTKDSYPFLISATWPDGSRAERISQLLEGRKGLTAADMAAIQLDEVSLPALELKELFGIPETAPPRVMEAARMLTAWDGRMEASRPEPLIFSAWADEVWRGLFTDDLAEDFVHFRSVRPTALIDALTRNRHWCDDARTPEPESCEQQIQAGLERAMQNLTSRFGPDFRAWRWGEAHRAAFQHPIMKNVPLLSGLGSTEIATGGDDFTINRGTFIPGQFQHVHGPGLRAVFDLSDLSASTFAIALGQAGNPLSRHYADQGPAWRSGAGFAIGKRQGEYAATLELFPGY